MSLPRVDQPFVAGVLETPIGVVPVVSSELTRADQWGGIKVRWGIGRMNYRVDPGLYALGRPAARSPVLVTANYKLSFDRLRRVLKGRQAWILVLDTDGINVWCAAGKGSFGTEELARRVILSGLRRLVTHRRLILPQLGAPGIAAHLVPRRCGFKAVYGPVRAEDLPSFLDNGLKADEAMRRKTFPLGERIALIPVELVAALKAAVFPLAAMFLVGGLGGSAGFWSSALNNAPWAVSGLLGAVSAGAVITPVLLPWLPGRAFSIKGLSPALLVFAFFVWLRPPMPDVGSERLELLAWLLLMTSISSYLAMNFTGASTYTSLSGVQKEMRWALPMQIGGAVAGLCLWLGLRLLS